MKPDGIIVVEDPQTGMKQISVKCSGCKRVEKATPTENKSEFIRSLGFAGWKFNRRSEQWICDRCEE